MTASKVLKLISFAWLVVVIVFIATEPTCMAQVLSPLETISIDGDLAQSQELSGITLIGNKMIVCPDEEASFNILKRNGPNAFTVEHRIQLLTDDSAELDLEGAASDGEFVYLIGSHGLARKAVKATRTYEDNLKALTKINDHDEADSLFRLKFDADGNLSSKEHISLRSVLESDQLLKPFNKIPSKENGVDIEGIAVNNGRMYVGFRGPVFRENYVPVMTFKFSQPEDYKLLFVNMDGRGIRDLTAVSDGFLIIGGPIGDGLETCELYHWNGKDCIPGSGSPGGVLKRIGTLPSTPDLKPEGICVLSEANSTWDVLLVRDGEENVSKYRINKPAP